MSRIERAALRSTLSILRYWPRRLVGLLASSLGPFLAILAKKESQQFDHNVERVFGLPAHSDFARMFKRQAIRHQIVCAVETLQCIQNPRKLEVQGYEDLQREIRDAEDSGKGHLIVTGHLGSWELVAYFGAKAARRPFYVLAKPARRHALTQILNDLREKMGVKVFWTDRKSLLRDMLKALRACESVGFVMDQKPEARQGPVVNFFGHETEFVSGPASMALKTDSTIIAVFCVRIGPYQYRLMSKTLHACNSAQPQNERDLTQIMATEIERVIRLYPEQWTWNYKRWRNS